MHSIYRCAQDDEAERDLSIARKRLRALAYALIDAAQSDDPRVVALGLALVRHQGQQDPKLEALERARDLIAPRTYMSSYIEISADSVADLPLTDYLRLITRWSQIALPHAQFHCTQLAVDGGAPVTLEEAMRITDVA